MRFEELWLLEVVIGAHPPWDGWIPFWGLPDDDPDERGCWDNYISNHADLNFAPHHIPFDTLVDELSRLFTNQEIVAAYLGYDRSEPERLFIPSTEEIVSGLSRGTKNPWLCYTLTEKGFQRWESYAKPDWSVYRQQGGIGGFGGGDGLVCTTAATADVARRWLEYMFPSDTLHWDRATLEIVRPWNVFPFKTLDSGVYVTVPTSGIPPGGPESAAEWKAQERRRESLLEGISPWYRHGVRTWTADRAKQSRQD